MKRDPLNPMVNGEPAWISRLFDMDTEDQEDHETETQSYIDEALNALTSMSGIDSSDPLAGLESDSSSGPPVADFVSNPDSGSLGLPADEQEAFDWIISQESKGDPHAVNPKSGAFGRAQFLPSNLSTYAKKAGVSNPRTTDPAEQDRMGLVYMNERYGGPKKARAFWEKHGWY